eukprot:1990579-Pleurochrysis_carterae.AAC.1
MLVARALHGFVQSSSRRHVPTCFSIVRRSACCAGLPASTHTRATRGVWERARGETGGKQGGQSRGQRERGK